MASPIRMALILFFATFFYTTQAQIKSKVISGKVISFEESFALEGASIIVKGTSRFTGTQPNGTFSLSIQPEDKILIISLAEYQPAEIYITSKNDYEIVLKRKSSFGVTTVKPLPSSFLNKTLMIHCK